MSSPPELHRSRVATWRAATATACWATRIKSVGVDQLHSYLMTGQQEATLEAYGSDIIPKFASVAACCDYLEPASRSAESNSW